ncbi:MAG: MBL fold metallo-hydrolase [Phycisphaerae bacterium]|nr:MBL fold metallo-hydrolase [Phycisphaerae bacterium]
MLIMTLLGLGLTTGLHGSGCVPADLNGDEVVDGEDLGLLLANWAGTNPQFDINEDGVIDGEDLGILLASWGPSRIQSGVFPGSWINGASCSSEPDIQVHRYNDDFWILRQSLCTNFEAPFIYLLFGQDKVLMQDTGAGGIDISGAVYDVIDSWLQANGKESIELIVSHSHGHGDHVAGDGQFQGQPDTTVVGLNSSSVASFFGVRDWPEQIVEYDLGDRIIDVIPIPGHQSAHVALYDRRTGILFTGDTLYPGRLYISNFSQYTTSIQRLVEFTTDKPTCHVLGTHIEMSNTPGDDYPFGATHHPDEHPIQLGREHLVELYEALLAMGSNPVYEVHDDFIIYPLGAMASTDGCCDRPTTVFEFKRLHRRRMELERQARSRQR